LQVRVKRLEFLGADWLIYGLLEGDGQEEKILSKVPPIVAATLREGELREFRVARKHLRWFDPATGLRVEDGPH
jgi:multiple sugar transport system ATP-binding protein